MKVLDLCSGHGNFSLAFLNRNHLVTRIDINPKFASYTNTKIRNILNFEPNEKYDVILASPPCEDFSFANLDYKRDLTNATKIANRTKYICEKYSSIWILENPHARLKNIIGNPNETIYQCMYGLSSKKPTDLWGNYFQKIGKLRINCSHVDHTFRNLSYGKRIGEFQWKEKETRAMIPYWLSETICRKIEKYLQA